jgi:hypothetical protein
VEELEQRL